MYQKILVAVDGSEASLRACERARMLALAGGACVTVCSVIVDRRSPTNPWEDLRDEATAKPDPFAQAQRFVEDRVASLRNGGVAKVDAQIVKGLPAVALAHLAKEGGYDLLVVGHRGLSKFDTLRLGSVSEHIAHQAPCDVLLVP